MRSINLDTSLDTAAARPVARRAQTDLDVHRPEVRP